MAQHTAVDIAFEKLANQGLLITKDYKRLVAYREANIMFQQQIEAAWKKGDGEYDEVADELSKKYYTETYVQ